MLLADAEAGWCSADLARRFIEVHQATIADQAAPQSRLRPTESPRRLPALPLPQPFWTKLPPAALTQAVRVLAGRPVVR